MAAFTAFMAAYPGYVYAAALVAAAAGTYVSYQGAQASADAAERAVEHAVDRSPLQLLLRRRS